MRLSTAPQHRCGQDNTAKTFFLLLVSYTASPRGDPTVYLHLRIPLSNWYTRCDA